MKLAIGSDHGGIHLKQHIMKHLEERGIAYHDFGCYDEASCDYPDFAQAAAQAVLNNECDRGLLFCGTGVGISIAANKMKGIRAAVCSDTFSARMTRLHNDANFLCMGERVVGPGLAADMVDLFLDTEFEGGRHQCRIDKISKLEDIEE